MLPIASRFAARWLVIATLVSLVAGLYFQDQPSDCECQDPAVEALRDRMEVESRFMDILHDRAVRWMEAHPNRCAKVGDIATTNELIEHNFKTVDLWCGERDGRLKIMLTTWHQLVRWRSFYELQ